MVSKKKLAVGALAVASIGLGAALLYRSVSGLNKAVLEIVIEGSGGSTNPAPGVYEKVIGTVHTIEAIPDSGYFVKKWTVDGMSAGTGKSISIWMNESHVIVVSFSTNPPPPPDYPPVALECLDAPSISLKQYYEGIWWIEGGNRTFYCVAVPIYDFNFLGIPENVFLAPTVKFKATDVNGNPTADVPIEVWTTPIDVIPAAFYISNSLHMAQNPIMAFTDSEGIIEVPVSYRHHEVANFAKSRCYLLRNWVNPLNPTTVDCVYPGFTTQADRPLGCWYQEFGVSYNAECPYATQFGPEYEIETVPMPHALSARIKDTSIASSCALTGWFGLMHTGHEES